MNNLKKFTILSIILILSSCGTIKDGFTNQKKNGSDEFLVEKKSPLIMPPNFEDLPIPSTQKVDNEKRVNNIESLISKKDDSEKLKTVESDKDFEKSILDKIKNN